MCSHQMSSKIQEYTVFMQTPLESFLGAVCQNPSVRFGTPAAQLSARWCRMSLPDLEGKNTSSPLKDFLRLVACVCSDHFRALNWLTQKWRIMRLCQLPFIYRTDIQRLKTKDKAVLCSWPGFLKPDVYLLCTTSATRQVHLSCLIQLSCRQVCNVLLRALQTWHELAGYLSLQQARSQSRGAKWDFLDSTARQAANFWVFPTPQWITGTVQPWIPCVVSCFHHRILGILFRPSFECCRAHCPSLSRTWT